MNTTTAKWANEQKKEKQRKVQKYCFSANEAAQHIERRKRQPCKTVHDHRLVEAKNQRQSVLSVGENVVVFAECRKWFGAG